MSCRISASFLENMHLFAKETVGFFIFIMSTYACKYSVSIFALFSKEKLEFLSIIKVKLAKVLLDGITYRIE